MADLAWQLWRRGYDAVGHDRVRRGGRTTYVSRLMGRRAVVVSGVEGARLFYDEGVVRRADAIPAPLGHLLFGRGAVHSTDDDQHRERKQLFVAPLHGAGVDTLAADAGARLARDLHDADGRTVSVHDLLVEAYGAAVLAWAGIDLDERAARRTARHYRDLVDGFGFAGAAYARAWAARVRTDRWARGVIRAHRTGTRRAPEGSFLARVADADLDVRLAAVELGNVLRPTVAVAWLGVGAAQALLEHPDRARRLADDDAARERAAFAHEVRRTTPFVPVLAGRVRVPRADGPDGTVLRQRDRVVLDVRGTHFRPDLHEHPLRFDPERFLDVEPGPFEVLAQGGGDLAGHRCPGERLTLALLEETVRVLARHQLTPTREPVLDPTRIPPLPAGGLEVRVAGMATEPGGTAVIDSRGTVGEHPR